MNKPVKLEGPDGIQQLRKMSRNRSILALVPGLGGQRMNVTRTEIERLMSSLYDPATVWAELGEYTPSVLIQFTDPADELTWDDIPQQPLADVAADRNGNLIAVAAEGI